jgi:hypothetical protein
MSETLTFAPVRVCHEIKDRASTACCIHDVVADAS